MMDAPALLTLVLLGTVSAASAARAGATLPLTLLLPPLTVLAATLLTPPAGLLAAAAVTVLSVTLTFTRGPVGAITSRDGLLIVFTLFAGLVLYAPLAGGIPATAYAVIIGLCAGCLAATHALNPLPELAVLGANGWRATLALLTLLTFAIGASFTEWLGVSAAAALLFTTAALWIARPSPPGSAP